MPGKIRTGKTYGIVHGSLWSRSAYYVIRIRHISALRSQPALRFTFPHSTTLRSSLYLSSVRQWWWWILQSFQRYVRYVGKSSQSTAFEAESHERQQWTRVVLQMRIRIEDKVWTQASTDIDQFFALENGSRAGDRSGLWSLSDIAAFHVVVRNLAQALISRFVHDGITNVRDVPELLEVGIRPIILEQ